MNFNNQKCQKSAEKGSSKKKKTRTHIAETEAEIDDVPKSMIMRRTKIEKEGKYLEKNLRELMYPYTTMKLKESLKLKMKDIMETSKNFNVKNLIFMTSKNNNLYLKFLVTPTGPTLTFKVDGYVLCSDLQLLIPKNKIINTRNLGIPMVICKGFEDGGNKEKPETNLMHSLFKNLFPGLLHHKNMNANSFKRCVFFSYNKQKEVVEMRNYFIKKHITDINKNFKKIINSSYIPNFENVNDVGDLLINNDPNLSESDIDFLPNSKVEIEDTLLGKRKKHQMGVRLYVILLGNRATINS